MKFLTLTGSELRNFVCEDSSYGELERNIKTAFPTTTRRQHATDEVAIQSMQYSLQPNNGLRIQARCTSHGNVYEPVIQISKIALEPAPAPGNVKIPLPTGSSVFTQPIKLDSNTVQVRCSCLDFYHRFAHYNHKDASLYGEPFPPYQRKTTTRPPANPSKLPGVCRHLIKMIAELTKARVVY